MGGRERKKGDRTTRERERERPMTTPNNVKLHYACGEHTHLSDKKERRQTDKTDRRINR